MSTRFETYRGTVYPWHCDHMGHMNVMWYAGKFDEATWQLLSELTLTPAWLRANGRGMVALEQRTAYLRELTAGSVVVVESAVVEVRSKTLRFAHFMRNVETRDLCAVTEITGAHLDLETRKSCPLPERALERATTRAAEVDLPWKFSSRSRST